MDGQMDGSVESNEKEWTTATHNMDDIHGLNAEQMKPGTKEYILYDSISTKFKNRQN